MSLECWLDSSKGAKETCLAEIEHWGFVIRHPDGGFRRFGYGSNGVLQPLDGTDAIEVGPDTTGKVEVTVSGDRYLLPKGLSR